MLWYVKEALKVTFTEECMLKILLSFIKIYVQVFQGIRS